MEPNQSYELIGPCQAQLNEKGSRFIAFAYPCKDMASFKNLLATKKREYSDATHICYAYIVRDEQGLHIKCHDDGEPSATAGKPILNHIEGRNLTNIVLFVVRYFGGVKLGAGGLVRAYGASARACLDQAKLQVFLVKSQLSIEIDYHLQSALDQLLKEYSVSILAANYAERVSYQLELADKSLEDFKRALEQIYLQGS